MLAQYGSISPGSWKECDTGILVTPDSWCDCMWPRAVPEDPTNSNSVMNTKCKSTPGIMGALFAPWTDIGAKARGSGTQAEIDAYENSIPRGDIGAGRFNTGPTAPPLNPFTPLGLGVVAAGIAALVLLKKRRRPASVAGYKRRRR